MAQWHHSIRRVLAPQWRRDVRTYVQTSVQDSDLEALREAIEKPLREKGIIVVHPFGVTIGNTVDNAKAEVRDIVCDVVAPAPAPVPAVAAGANAFGGADHRPIGLAAVFVICLVFGLFTVAGLVAGVLFGVVACAFILADIIAGRAVGAVAGRGAVTFEDTMFVVSSGVLFGCLFGAPFGFVASVFFPGRDTGVVSGAVIGCFAGVTAFVSDADNVIADSNNFRDAIGYIEPSAVLYFQFMVTGILSGIIVSVSADIVVGVAASVVACLIIVSLAGVSACDRLVRLKRATDDFVLAIRR
jgi:hypothetical protein